MKIIAKPVKAIAVFDYDGTITPCKFKYKKSMDEEKEVVVENTLFSERHKIAGVVSIMYRCENYVEMELSIFVQCLNPQNYAASANGCSRCLL